MRRFQDTLVQLLPHLPESLIDTVAGRYIAGKTAEEALRLAQNLNALGFRVTLDILGEDVTTDAEADAAAAAYLSLLRSAEAAGLSPNVSLKLTQFGLREDPAAATRRLTRVLDFARTIPNSFVRIDMEEAALTDTVLEVARTAQNAGYRAGTVLQARLKRTVSDAATIRNANVRVCKGAYKESPDIAFENERAIRRSFMDTFFALVDNGCTVAAATHDRRLIRRIRHAMDKEGIPPERVEFQSLLGVPIRQTLESLRDDGCTVRLYVPFGTAATAYSLRRLDENPDIARAVVKGLLLSDRLDAATIGQLTGRPASGPVREQSATRYEGDSPR